MKCACPPRRRNPMEMLAAGGRRALMHYRGYGYIGHLAHTIENNLSRPLEDLEAEQDRAIEAIVNHAYGHSPFCRERYSACGFKPGDVKNRADLDFSPCACGRTSPRLRNIRGRETDVIWCPDGHGVAGFMIVSLVGSQEIHAPVQFVQDRLDHVTIRLEAQQGAWADQLRRLTEIFRREISTDMSFEIEWVDHIERSPSGKYRYVMSTVPRPTIVRRPGQSPRGQ